VEPMHGASSSSQRSPTQATVGQDLRNRFLLRSDTYELAQAHPRKQINQLRVFIVFIAHRQTENSRGNRVHYCGLDIGLFAITLAQKLCEDDIPTLLFIIFPIKSSCPGRPQIGREECRISAG
jgi:hypothetical protein